MRKKMIIGIGVFFLVVAVMFLFGYAYGSRHFVVREQTLYFDDLPREFDGYRIVQFSDFHAGAFHLGHDKDVAEIVDLINAQKADLIVFTGDLVTRKSSELDGFIDTLSHLSAPDGVYSVMGNHDYALYMRHYTVGQRLADVKELHRKQAAMGWHLLLNEHEVIHRGADSIVIVGVENDGTPPHFPQYGDLVKATDGVADGAFKILLSHDPTHWQRSVIPDTDIQLTLSGHTHAGQFHVFGWSPVKHVYQEWTGVYTNETIDKHTGTSRSQTINVSEGVGCVPIPFRVGAWPEICVLTLRCK